MHKPRKLVQRTLYSQVEELKNRVDADIRSSCSEPVKIFKGRKKQSIKDPFYEQFDDEEDYLLTHMAEMITKRKKEQAAAALLNEYEQGIDQEQSL
jgi:hypothetical protein